MGQRTAVDGSNNAVVRLGGMQEARTYRVYRLDGRGKVRSGEWFGAVDDDDACRIALEHCDEETPKIELWQGPRRVRQIDCREAASAQRRTG